MDATVAIRPVRERRPFGAYYTPRTVADTLAKWAIRSAGEAILEPGFGGCGFLEASWARLNELGVMDATGQICGCDTDPTAFAILGRKIDAGGLGHRFIQRDFLQLWPEDFDAQAFDVVIGNPPYVSLHAMSIEQRKVAAEAMGRQGIVVDKRASLWAYFVLHALRFLKRGGRCAWVLPSSYLHADYAGEVRRKLMERFERVVEITLEQRLFAGEGAKERTVVVLAEGFRATGGASEEPQRFHAADADVLDEVVRGIIEGDPVTAGRGQSLSPEEEGLAHLEAVRARPVCRQLGNFLEAKIGIVTGANGFFIKSESDWKLRGIAGAAVRPIVAKFGQVAGLELTGSDLEENRTKGLKCLLLDTDEGRERLRAVKRFLASLPRAEREKNCTFKKRACWHRPDDGRVPDGFLSYMCDHGPRLALNGAKTTSTNTVHRLYFHEGVDEIRRKAVALSVLTTVTQLSAELVGRSYGSGVLKLEPSEARRLDIVLPDLLDAERVSSLFDTADRLLREGKEQEARAVADGLFVAPLIEAGKVASMEVVLARLRSIRREPRRRR